MLFFLAILAVLERPVLLLSLFLNLGFTVGYVNLADAVGTLVVFAWSCGPLVRRAKEGLPDARLLLAPVLISLGLDSARSLLWGLFSLDGRRHFLDR